MNSVQEGESLRFIALGVPFVTDRGVSHSAAARQPRFATVHSRAAVNAPPAAAWDKPRSVLVNLRIGAGDLAQLGQQGDQDLARAVAHEADLNPVATAQITALIAEQEPVGL